MRALRILGLADGGRSLLCEDPSSAEQFTLPVDGTLRAAVRGETAVLGQLEFDGDAQLRPKEIQSRIRAGASVEELAALAGTSLHRIERFAHPVLLERSSIAEKARKARPSIDGISGLASLETTVAGALAARGNEDPVVWDAHKEDGDWVLTLSWNVGRSTRRAEWTYHRGPDGGTLTARNDAAADLVDPALKILRPMRELRAVGGPAVPMAPRSTAASAPTPPPALLDPTVPTVPTAPAEPVVERERRLVEETVTDERSGAVPPKPKPETPSGERRTGTDSARPASRGGRRPAMPSWEEVLLGTRSTKD
ncbi:DUF3071 domain-containing protein [Nakamurella sp. YIM 132087]|uniref:DUF3071 domain-containing protein n=1 Tax=Nakamurella alba TaxID=2665158 RepID=A0A7K1FUU3_9ACTN|nr:septation protein SepH [Nakamurella alba]MTD16973.1 DUF3071 domain-containing protein [Nakamurella alba]